MKKNKITKFSFIFSIFYLITFSIFCYFYFTTRAHSSSIFLPKNIKYTNFDLHHNGHYLGSYYYSFTKNGLQFYFLHQKPPISTSIKYEGYYEEFSKNTENIKEKLGKKIGFSKEEINQLTTQPIFLEKEPISSFHIFFLTISTSFAFYFMIECILFLKQ